MPGTVTGERYITANKVLSGLAGATLLVAGWAGSELFTILSGLEERQDQMMLENARLQESVRHMETDIRDLTHEVMMSRSPGVGLGMRALPHNSQTASMP